MNLYLEPPLAPEAAPSRRPGNRVDGADPVTRGLDALLARRTEGHWQDCALPVGASDAWVTAYVLAMTAGPGAAHPAFVRAASVALDWLATRQTPGAGWGYNATVPDDADSTAWAIVALRAWDRSPPAGARDFLRACAAGDGYFATYPRATTPRPGWAQPAADVTALAAWALGQGLPADFWTRDAGRLVASYWWTAPCYSTAMALRCPNAAEPPGAIRAAIAAAVPGNDFERALWLQAGAVLGLPCAAAATRLAAGQSADGSWPSAAGLRLTDGQAGAPATRLDSGVVYRDVRRVFTTATAIAALIAVRSGPCTAYGSGCG